VVDKNAAYVESLAQLRNSMQDIAQGARNPDPGVFQSASQNYEKAMDSVRQLARSFKPVGVGGLDTTVEALLEAPIRLTSAFIIRPDPGKDANGGLRTFCASERSTLRKYPFQSSSNEDATLQELAALLQPGSGAVWKLQQQSLADFVVKDGPQWKPKDPAKTPQVTPAMLMFLNTAQAAANAFYGAGGNQPQLVYAFRPKLDPSLKDTILDLEIDGTPHPWTNVIQKQFTWPASVEAQNAGAIARLRNGNIGVAFASEGGVWGIFKILRDAEPRELNAKVVEWKYTSGGVGRRELITPAPVQLEIVGFPGGVDVFNPKFWSGFGCPNVAVQ
jgi:type VI secretion system protein ImpL